MGPAPPCPPQGLSSCPPWPWGIGEHSMPELKTWWLDRMEALEGGGLRFFLRFGPGKVDRTLLGVSLPALFSRALGWTRNGAPTTESAAAVVSAAALAAAVSLCLAGMHASSQRPRLARRRRLSAAVLAGPSSAAGPRARRAPDDGLKILSSKDESLDNVIHGTSIGAGDEEPTIVARVETTQPDTTGANANGETEPGQSDEEREEAERLRELWLSLVEREQRLQLRLQELEARREEEVTVRELENRVAAAAMETRLLELKVSSLQEENGRLRAQLEEMDDARVELARAKEMLRAIKARVQGEQEEAAALRARVAELESGGQEKATALADEVAALQEANAKLEEENMELALRLQDAEQAASSVHLAIEEKMVEEARQLRESNEILTRQIEELRGDQYAHVEELVYLKWVNACLRHELSDHGLHPPFSAHHHQDHDADGGMSAMELSKSMSFRSSERAKQLMLQYGHPGLDPALFSPVHESIDGDERTRSYDEPARSPAATSLTTTTTTTAGKKSSGHRNKLKFLGNFKKLLHGGGRRSHSSSHGGRESSRQAPAPSADEYIEKAMQWLSTHDVLDFDHSYETTPLSSCDRTPPSTATTRGGVAHQEDAATLARSKSDGGKSYGREASRYHSLRPDHPADEAAALAPEKRGPRRRSEELTKASDRRVPQ